MGSVSIILVNWNGWRDTIECLESLLRMDGSFDVVIVDNASGDGSIENILRWAKGDLQPSYSEAVWSGLRRDRIHRPAVRVVEEDDLQPVPQPAADERIVTLVRSRSNRGFSGGNNLGIRIALRDPDCRHLWILNNDTVVEPGALDEMLTVMGSDEAIAICGSTLVYYHEPSLVQGLGGWYSLLIARGGHIGAKLPVTQLPPRAEVERRIDYVMGASMLVRRELFERIGGLEEGYFLYCEELDLSRQLRGRERLGWADRSIVYHKEGGSIGSSSTARPSDTSLYYLQASMLKYYRKYYPYLLPIPAARILRHILGASIEKDRNAAAIGWLVLKDFVAGYRRTGKLSPVSATTTPAGSQE